MDLTISSVTTMCLLNSILIMLLCFIFKIDIIMKKVGPGCMITILLAIMIRMFIPLEFPYTYTLKIEDILTPFRRMLTYQVLDEPIEITVCHVLVMIWAIGILCSLAKKLYVYRRFIRCIELLPEEQWDTICERYQFNKERYPDVDKMKVVYCKQFNSPYLVGVRKPYLVLSKDNYNKEQFQYIVLHELMHVRNKDIVWKILIDLLCTVFWWNPVFYYLKKELFQLIEMRNDMQILSMLSEEEKISYMKCLKAVAAGLSSKDIAFGVAFSRNDLKELERRMNLIVSDKRFSRLQQIILSIIACTLLFLTSAVIIEPYSVEKIEEEVVFLTSNNTFLIVNGDKYDVYINEKYVFTTEDLTGFHGVNVYNNLKEVGENE